MALDINNLLPQFEQAMSELGLEYLAAPGLILTEVVTLARYQMRLSTTAPDLATDKK